MKDVKKLSLGSLIGELMNTEKQLDSIAIENDLKINLQGYKHSILSEIDKREEDYKSYKNPTLYK